MTILRRVASERDTSEQRDAAHQMGQKHERSDTTWGNMHARRPESPGRDSNGAERNRARGGGPLFNSLTRVASRRPEAIIDRFDINSVSRKPGRPLCAELSLL